MRTFTFDGIEFRATQDLTVASFHDGRTQWDVDRADQDKVGAARVQVLEDGTIVRDKNWYLDSSEPGEP